MEETITPEPKRKVRTLNEMKESILKNLSYTFKPMTDVALDSGLNYSRCKQLLNELLEDKKVERQLKYDGNYSYWRLRNG